jgi:hypothetical protein
MRTRSGIDAAKQRTAGTTHRLLLDSHPMARFKLTETTMKERSARRLTDAEAIFRRWSKEQDRQAGRYAFRRAHGDFPEAWIENEARDGRDRKKAAAAAKRMQREALNAETQAQRAYHDNLARGLAVTARLREERQHQSA